ncbi:MAG TPA: hypothetical protein VF796_16400 [Humisphaera sp.]
MAAVTEQVYQASRAARVVGGILVAVAALLAIVLVMMSDHVRYTTAGLVGFTVVVALYAVTGGLFFWFAAVMMNGRRWGAIAAMVSSGFVAAVSVASAVRSMDCFSGVVLVLMTFPAAYAVARCWTAAQDLRPRADRWSAGGGRQGFPVVPRPPLPPPVARLAPRRSGESPPSR